MSTKGVPRPQPHERSDDFRLRVMQAARELRKARWDKRNFILFEYLNTADAVRIEMDVQSAVLDVLASEPWVRDEWARTLSAEPAGVQAYGTAHIVQATLRRTDADA